MAISRPLDGIGAQSQPFAAKFEAFGWKTLTIDGNSMEAVVDALKKIPQNTEGPTRSSRRRKKASAFCRSSKRPAT